MIGDRYQVVRLSQEDTSTLTITARHLSLDELLDVRFLQTSVRLNSKASTHFTRAARALAGVKTDHVERVLDLGIALSVGPYLVLEHLDGTSLADALRTAGKLDGAHRVMLDGVRASGPSASV